MVPVQGVEIELKIVLLKTVTCKKKHIDRKWISINIKRIKINAVLENDLIVPKVPVYGDKDTNVLFFSFDQNHVSPTTKNRTHLLNSTENCYWAMYCKVHVLYIFSLNV